MRDNRIVRVEDRIVLPNVLRLNVRRADDWDKIVATRTSHNIVVNDGRTWIRGLLGASSFQNAAATPNTYPGDGTAWTVDDALQPPFNNYRLRYMSLGAGGMFAVGGTYAEAVTINGLETPVQINLAGDRFLKECLPSPNAFDLDVFPTIYDFAARCVWGSEDISYAAVGPGSSVAVSEIAIFTSQADPAADKLDLTSPTGIPGIAAWNCFTPVTKTQDVVFEAIWLWRL